MKYKRLNKKLARVSKKVNKYFDSKEYRRLYLKYAEEEAEIKTKIYNILIPHLLISDPAFSKIAEENVALLLRDNIVAETRRINYSFSGYHASVLEGTLRRNGLFYCNTLKTNFPIFTFFAQYQFPKKFIGTINCLGFIHLEAIETDYSLFKTLPKKFIVNITSRGRITIETIENEYDVLSNGKMIISQIVGKLFSQDSDKIEQFYFNRSRLIEILELYRQNNPNFKE